VPAPCGGDPLVCIEFVVRGIGDFLSDWTTLGLMAILLGLLLRLRADRQTALDAAHAARMGSYEEARRAEAPEPTWVIDDDPAGRERS